MSDPQLTTAAHVQIEAAARALAAYYLQHHQSLDWLRRAHDRYLQVHKLVHGPKQRTNCVLQEGNWPATRTWHHTLRHEICLLAPSDARRFLRRWSPKDDYYRRLQSALWSHARTATNLKHLLFAIGPLSERRRVLGDRLGEVRVPWLQLRLTPDRC